MDMSTGEGGDEKPWDRYEIVIISMNQRFWLWRGDAYLQRMLRGESDVPWPVGCVVIDDARKLNRVVPEDVDLGDLWMINAMAMANMRSDERVVDIYPEL